MDDESSADEVEWGEEEACDEVGCDWEEEWGLVEGLGRGEEEGFEEGVDEGLEGREEGVVDAEC